MDRILIVDDEVEIARALRRLFRREGYEVELAGGGAEALALLDRFTPDLIISDFRMPGMDGVEFLSRAKLRCPLALRVVLSGFADLKSIVSAVNEGEICRFISKPWDDAQLLQHVRQLLEQRRAMAELYERLGLPPALASAELLQRDAAIQLRFSIKVEEPFTAGRAAELLRRTIVALSEERSQMVAGLLERKGARVSIIADVGGSETVTVEVPRGETEESPCPPAN